MFKSSNGFSLPIILRTINAWGISWKFYALRIRKFRLWYYYNSDFNIQFKSTSDCLLLILLIFHSFRPLISLLVWGCIKILTDRTRAVVTSVIGVYRWLMYFTLIRRCSRYSYFTCYLKFLNRVVNFTK